MTASLSQRAAIARQTLYSRYDELNALWVQAEEQLSKYHIPRDAWHCYRSWSDEDYEYNEYLGIEKVGSSKWRICHGTDCSACPEEPIRWTPILDCSVEIRVAAAKHIGALREAVVKSSEEFILKVDGAIESMKNELLSGNEQLQILLAERARLNGSSN